MTTYVTLLRAVNLGPSNRIRMADLIRMLTASGMIDVRTLLVSGNAVFRSTAASSSRLERTFEAAATKMLRLSTDFFVRTAAELDAAIAANPLRAEARADPARLHLLMLKADADPPAVASLQRAIKGREQVRGGRRVLYVVYPDGVGQSKLTLGVIEKALGTRATGRNWNTVLKLAAAAAEGETASDT